ncbi:hypothetical protein ABID29_001620 [Streptococcus rupicaprae]|uniref:Uncharacterized protein n=1 Tax=Streptococcus rupicaprae TaxID=759619 RepID=A0ABV2FIU9_9STRE
MYKVVTTDDCLTLHEALLTDVFIGDNLVWRFADGFDVSAAHSLNPTGRYKHTGPAEVEMVNARLVDAIVAYAPDGY